jgi:hypothetical protein
MRALVRIGVGLAALALLWVVVNGLYQVIRKPTELFLPVSGRLYKTPSETWRTYAPLFRRHSTALITPELPNPFEIYRPASSAVGMYQITDGAFERAQRYCIRDHVVVEEGPWHDWRSCWFNALYFRVLPSHAIELTSAFLDRSVRDILARHRIRGASRTEKQRLAVLIHLCGPGAANRLARRGLEVPAGLRCGDHAAAGYLRRIEAMRRKFASLAAGDG